MVRRLKCIKKSTWIKFFTGCGLFALCGLLVWGSPLRSWFSFDRIVELVGFVRSNPWAVVFFYLFFILAVLWLPITLFPIIGGVIFHFWIAFPLNLLAATAGAWIAFAIARFFGRDTIEFFLRGKLRSFDRVAAARGFKTVLVLRLMGIPPFGIMNYALGLSGISWREYLLGTVAGILPWMCFITYASHSLWDAILAGGKIGLVSALLSKVGPLMMLSALMAVFLMLSGFVKKIRKDHPAEPSKPYSNL